MNLSIITLSRMITSFPTRCSQPSSTYSARSDASCCSLQSFRSRVSTKRPQLSNCLHEMIDFRINSGKADADNGRYSNTNIPVTSQQGLASLSPYLNFDPSYLPVSQPEFIFPDGAVKQRGRFELAFSQIGAACIAGAGIGGASGLYRGIKATSIAGETGKLRRTQLINHVMKGGASMANSLGVIMIMYTCAGIGLTWLRGTDDSLNTVAAAATSATVFRSPAGIRKAGIAGAMAAGIAVMYCAWNNGGLSLHRVNGWKHAA